MENQTQPDTLKHLPPHLRATAAKLPREEAHTVLTLPEEGEGHNAGLVKVASICYRMGVSFEDTLAHLENIYSAERLDHRTAPRRAVTRIWQGEGALTENEGKEVLPDMQDELLLRFRRTATSGIVDVSPHKINLKPSPIIKGLFNEDEIINIQIGKLEAGTLVKVKDLDEKFPSDQLPSYKFLNPSTFKKVEGVPIPDPKNLGKTKLSTRCNANVKIRPYMVLEMDGKDDVMIERFSTFALELAKFAPLKMVVDTGNKSQHFWFDTRNAEEKEVTAIFALACLHGADKQMGVRSQIARMPNVSASDEGRGAQRVLYFDPNGEKYPSAGGRWDVAGFEKFIQLAQQLDFYYHPEKSRYYAQSNAEAWIALNRTSLTHQLARRGFRHAKLEGEVLSPVEEIISGIEMDKPIEEALKGASGRHAGYYEENGFRFLVTKSPHFIKPRKGNWETIKGLFGHMFDHELEQLDVFYGWCSSSVKDLRNSGKRRALFSPAQKLHIMGDPNSGKSLILKYILPAIFGGRSADADDLFSDKGANFNTDIFQSELIYLDDTDVLQSDYKFRAKYGERIKSFTVGAGGSYHQKFGDKVPIAPWWRIVRMMNLELATLDTLPPLDEGVVDKLIFLKAQSLKGGSIDTTQAGWFDPIRDKIISELSAFIHFLLEEYTIPDHIVDPSKRFAVKSYLNPQILSRLGENSPESYLLHKIDLEARDKMFVPVFSEELNQWEGSANDLYELLLESGSRNSQERFKKTCPSPKVLAHQLKQIMKDMPERVEYSGNGVITPAKRGGNFYWRINPKYPVQIEDCF